MGESKPYDWSGREYAKLVNANRVIYDLLGVEQDYWLQIVYEDDWTFIIKINAIIESALSLLLIERFDDSRLKDLIVKMPMSSASGKIAILSSLKLVNSEQKKLLEVVSSIRNVAAHNAKSINFDMVEYLSGCKEGQRKRYLNAVNHKELEVEGDTEEFVLRHPRQTIWLRGTLLLQSMCVSILWLRAYNIYHKLYIAGLIESDKFMLYSASSMGGIEKFGYEMGINDIIDSALKISSDLVSVKDSITKNSIYENDAQILYDSLLRYSKSG